ncbi:MAG: tetratricopeptide repeat protein [Bacteroides sp.]|nr:tetratricopeptide repeat protein [Bacteroides sp.]MCM1378761.1 tetratricopeptide repeat protein [Bacteroides sp.]MCM1445378.1 tetratricopeptide repeat protein [Prevotella sp.]
MKIKSLMLAMAAATAVFASAQHQGYKDGIDYYKADQLENAKEILTKTIDAPETDRAEALYYLGAIELREGNVDKAKQLFTEGTELDPKNGYNFVGLGAICLKNGDTKAADEEFKKAVKAEKKAYIYTAIARAYYDADKVAYAKDYQKYLESARGRDKKDPSIYVLQGDIYRDEALAAGMDDGAAIGKAASEYEQAIHFSPNSPEAYVKYARVYKGINPEYAIQRLKDLNEIAPNSALAQRELANTYFDTGRWALAAKEYATYLENPNHFVEDEAHYTVLLYNDGRYDESVALAHKILAKEPNNVQAQRILFWDLEKMGDFDGARKAAEDFINTPGAPLNATDYSTYANILAEVGDYDAEIEARKKAIEVNPDKKDLLKDLSLAYQHAGSRANKAEDVEGAHANYIKSAETLEQLIETGEYNKDYKVQDVVDLGNRYYNVVLTSPADSTSTDRAFYADKGIAALDRVIELVPDHVVPYRNRARLFLAKNGNKSDQPTVDAYTLFLEKLDADPSNKEKRLEEYNEAYVRIASYYIAQKDYDNAKAWYTKMLELDPENQALKDYIDGLGKKK